MAIKRHFLGLERPALTAAAEYLLQQHARGKIADLRDLTVVLPVGRAGRRLLEILVDLADRGGLTFVPPTITTVGQLPELLYPARKPFADDFVQQLVWAEALRQTDQQQLAAMLADRPGKEDLDRWLDLARLLQSLHRELASDGLDFESVIRHGASLSNFAEPRRWQAMAAIQREYLTRLDALGLWDRQTARLFAIEHRECRIRHPLVLVAAVDLNRSMRQMLDQIPDRVTALIYAPPEWSDRFDSHGCLLPDAWSNVHLPLADQDLTQAENPVDQAERVARRIAEYDGRFSAEEITVGLPDERIVPQIVRQLDECQLPCRYGPGQLVARTAVFGALNDLAAYASSRSYGDFARLVRQPDIESWLLGTGVRPGWIERLDVYYSEHLPRLIDEGCFRRGDRFDGLRDVLVRVSQLVDRLHGPPRPLKTWMSAIDQLLYELYGKQTFDREDEAQRVAWKAIQTVRDTLGDLASIPRAVMPETTGPDALQLLLERIQSQRIAAVADEAAIELLGWLELPLDDAPALIVTSFNEGFVPSSVNADLFLPGEMRSALGLDDNARRYARDAYAVSTLLVPWRDATFIVARRNQDDEPLAPSRLAFAAPPETVAQRVLRLFGDDTARNVEPPLAGRLTTARSDAAFYVPQPSPLAEPIQQLSVTAFKTYLACPYRFYLSRVLKLRHVDDDATELDGGRFGDLTHNVLEQFGKGDLRNATDASQIAAELNRLLDDRVEQLFGQALSAALMVQVEQLRLRLQAFARWQAARAADGWRIEHAEVSFSDRPGKLHVDGEVMQLTGRIDRIDVHEPTGRRMILDYKTSDAGDSPEKTHRRRSREWIDLQLPLYRHLVREMDIHGHVDMGFILLPKSTAKIGLSAANWNDDDLATADEVARNVVRKIWAQEFWPPTEPPPAYSEEFAAICLDGVFGRKHEA